MSMQCGVDFPKIYYDLLRGKNIDPVFDFRTGVTYLRCIIDMYNSYCRLSTGKERFGSVAGDLFRKYVKVVFNPGDNMIDELPWKNPHYQWIKFYMKRLKEYG